MNKHISIRIMQAGFRITHSARFNYNTFQIRAPGAPTERREWERERGGGILTLSTYPPPPYFLLYPKHNSRLLQQRLLRLHYKTNYSLFFSQEGDDSSCKRVEFWEGGVGVDFRGECNIMWCSCVTQHGKAISIQATREELYCYNL